MPFRYSYCYLTVFLYCKYYSQVVLFLVSNQIDSELLTDYYLTGYRVLGIVYLDQLMGARHAQTYLIMIPKQFLFEFTLAS